MQSHFEVCARSPNMHSSSTTDATHLSQRRQSVGPVAAATGSGGPQPPSAPSASVHTGSDSVSFTSSCMHTINEFCESVARAAGRGAGSEIPVYEDYELGPFAKWTRSVTVLPHHTHTGTHSRERRFLSQPLRPQELSVQHTSAASHK